MIELHGTAFRVMCLNCNHNICRHELQKVFQKLNPSMIATAQMIRPDGDVELSQVHSSIYMFIPVMLLNTIYIILIMKYETFDRHKWKASMFLLAIAVVAF